MEYIVTYRLKGWIVWQGNSAVAKGLHGKHVMALLGGHSLQGNGSADNNGGIVGEGVFNAVRAVAQYS
jgi:hypothetical protein